MSLWAAHSAYSRSAAAISCSLAAVSYTRLIQRPFVFVTKDGAELSEAAQAFIDFATSDAASELIVNAGAVPVAK